MIVNYSKSSKQKIQKPVNKRKNFYFPREKNIIKKF